jgi:hypothetical protein
MYLNYVIVCIYSIHSAYSECVCLLPSLVLQTTSDSKCYMIYLLFHFHKFDDYNFT